MRTPSPTAVLRTRKEVAAGITNADILVGILSPATMGAQGDIILGIKEANDAAPIMMAPIVYATHGLEEVTIKIMLHRAIDEECQLIICLGRRIALTVAAELERLTIDLPFICVPTADPLYVDCPAAQKLPQHNSITVGMTSLNLTENLAFFCSALPKAHKVLLPSYQPGGMSLEENMTVWQAEQFLKKEGREVIRATGHNVTDLYNAVDEMHQYADAIVLLEGCMMLDVYRAMGHICEEREIPLFAGSSRALKRSAALGYAGQLHSVGHEALRIAQRVLFNKENINTLADVVVPDTRTPMINNAIAPLQGLDVEELDKKFGDVAQVFATREMV